MPRDESDQLRPSTPPVDPRVAAFAQRYTERSVDDEDHSDLDDDELFEDLEKELEGSMDGFREKRMQELKREMEKVKDMREKEHGKYTEVTNEKEVIKICANEERCVVHFYHRNFQRCKIMDKHLEEIAPRYFSTRFIRVFVENVPWLVEKLAIKVLPCVICFVKGASADRIVGFEELGNQDSFSTPTLEVRLGVSGVLEKSRASQSSGTAASGSNLRGRDDRDDDDDPFGLDD